MIRIERIRIQKFRGIIDLELALGGENFAACGPNGTGKSGIVDAIEFALTGNISRLSGQGTGDLSVPKHGPHVDFRNKPEQASVELEVSFPTLAGKKATILRTVKAAGSPKVTPSDPDILAALQAVSLHPEFVLSRRELIRYVISKPGDRAKEVQALLRLEDVEKLRGVLLKIQNAASKAVDPLERVAADARTALLTALQISDFTKTAVLQAVNPHRATLGLAPLTDLAATTALDDGMQSASGGLAAHSVPKAQAKADIAAMKEQLAGLESADFAGQLEALLPELEGLAGDPASADGVKRETLINTALEMYDDERCPVCDTPFEPDHFTAHLKAKLDHLADVTARRKKIAEATKPITAAIHAAGTALATVIAYGAQLKPVVDTAPLLTFKQTLAGRYVQIDKLLPLADTLAVLKASYGSSTLTEAVSALEAAVEAIPDASLTDTAKQFLTIAQERLSAYRKAQKSLATSKAQATRAVKVYEVFGASTTTALEGIYKDVQEAFSELYREINKDDESGFTAKLIPSLGKLGFDVDFYGRGGFPPGAYHSEGHQDGMGLCLYLALMQHLLGTGFSFAVLDDVLMSVDRGHRREVCALLKTRFPDTQFIFTTHDDVWLKHMVSEGLIKNKRFVHFKTWSVDVGPAQWTKDSVWDEIDGHVQKNEISVAAGILRRHLEYFAGEAAHRLRGKAEFKGDGNFVFGDLIIGATSAMSEAFKKGKEAANSWNQQDKVAVITTRHEVFKAAEQAAKLDQWQVNASIHWNPWADMQKADFMPVVAAYRTFTDQFSCTSCSAMLSITPTFGTKQELRCDCGASNINLNAKK
ncbi:MULTISPECIES: AAA family ATPase [Caulobacter]|uniref:AAA family ATPase n=1 Tax=Caulobacter TaxID=75 RepID=UPI000BB4B6AD|nr:MULTISPECIES: AAA family ATPase [Caulobacter]ATC24347.1 chromosome segregation protein SMC [Caulobacter vibrioides]MBQ1562456.1 AAA family ATPase [Caulobacter sp.]